MRKHRPNQQIKNNNDNNRQTTSQLGRKKKEITICKIQNEMETQPQKFKNKFVRYYFADAFTTKPENLD